MAVGAGPGAPEEGLFTAVKAAWISSEVSSGSRARAESRARAAVNSRLPSSTRFMPPM
ncbi:MAG: hypothetical protein R3B70_28030 [Polyangiaceae bacterium]